MKNKKKKKTKKKMMMMMTMMPTIRVTCERSTIEEHELHQGQVGGWKRFGASGLCTSSTLLSAMYHTQDIQPGC